MDSRMRGQSSSGIPASRNGWKISVATRDTNASAISRRLSESSGNRLMTVLGSRPRATAAAPARTTVGWRSRTLLVVDPLHEVELAQGDDEGVVSRHAGQGGQRVA